MLAQGQSSVECQRLKSDIYISLRVWHSTSITNFSRENLLSEAFSLTILSLTVLILPELFYSIFIFYFEFWCSRNPRVHLSIGCPHYSRGGVMRAKCGVGRIALKAKCQETTTNYSD